MAQSSSSREDSSSIVRSDPPSLVEISGSSSSYSVGSFLSNIENVEDSFEPADDLRSEFARFKELVDQRIERIPFTGASVSGVEAATVNAPWLPPAVTQIDPPSQPTM